jgi:hypothetical protein
VTRAAMDNQIRAGLLDLRLDDSLPAAGAMKVRVYTEPALLVVVVDAAGREYPVENARLVEASTDEVSAGHVEIRGAHVTVERWQEEKAQR